MATSNFFLSIYFVVFLVELRLKDSNDPVVKLLLFVEFFRSRNVNRNFSCVT